MSVRPMAVAGLFYSGEKAQLEYMLDNFFQQAQQAIIPELKALVVPHAGYIYSGSIAATAYKSIATRRLPVQRVLLLGPAHRVAFNGVADSGYRQLDSPLGSIPCDIKEINRLHKAGLVQVNEPAHRKEHSLEVQFPFLKRVFNKQVTVLPLLAGSQSEALLLEILQITWQPEDLIIVSSDLSHFLSYEEAMDKDKHTSELICQLSAELDGYQACGAHPLNALMIFAKRKGWKVKCLDLRNSGDTAGDKQRVVGYGAYAFF